MSYLAEADGDSALTPLQAAACTYRIALGPRAGQKLLSLQTVPSRQANSTQPGCVNAHGFSLHAAVRCGADQRKELERLPAHRRDYRRRHSIYFKQPDCTLPSHPIRLSP
jgi:hypothetical protein